MKTLRSKLTVVFAFFAVVALAFGIAFMPKQASAAVDTSTGFYIEDGASIRTEVGESGIKWTAHISETKYAELNTEANSVVAIGIAIQPQGNTDSKLDIHYEYGYDSFEIAFTEGDFEYSYAIYYDDLIADIEAIKGDLDTDAEKEYLLEAYQTILEARPFVKHADGTYTYGKYFDTARSLQGVAVGNLVAGTYAEGSAEDTLLKSYLPNGYKLADTEYVADSYYSNYDAWGNIAINSNIPMSNARVYYGANDVTSAYNKDTGILALTEANKVETKITTDGKANDFVTIYDQSTGNVYKQKFVGVTLAIDKAEDLSYFQVKKDIVFDSSNANTRLRFADGDVEFNGYYVLLNDIDSTNYAHDFVNYSVMCSLSARSWVNVEGYLVNKGLTGTFDGRGHIISNLHFSNTSPLDDEGKIICYGAGLFGYVNGGTIKNVGFYDPNLNAVEGVENAVTLRQAGFIADKIWNNSIIENCYFYLNRRISTSGQRWLGTTDSDTTMKNCFFHLGSASNFGYNANMTSGLFSGYTGMTDSYIVFSQPIEIGSRSTASAAAIKLDGTEVSLRPARVVSDAAYVDGVANVATSNKFWSACRYDTPYGWDQFASITYNGVVYTKDSTYDINLMLGLQRYTSLAMMNPANNTNATNNDFSAWNPDVWTIVDGVPTFKSVLESDYTYMVGDLAIEHNTVTVEAEKNYDVTVQLNGVNTGIAPKITLVSGNQYVSVNGNTVTTLGAGLAEIKVVYGSSVYNFTMNIIPANYVYLANGSEITEDGFALETNTSLDITVERDGVVLDTLPILDIISGGEYVSIDGNVITGIAKGEATVKATIGSGEYIFTVYVTNAPIVIEGQFKFSAHDGQFYDDSYNVLTIADVVGQQISIISAVDGKGNALTVGENNVILGLDPGKSTGSWVDSSITVYTADESFVIYLNAADAIIDSVADLDVFKFQGDATVSADSFVYSGPDTFVWDGYYILVKDIDSYGTVFISNINATFDPTAITMENFAKTNYGFSGVFDGQGHKISRWHIQSFSAGSGTSNGVGPFTYLNGGTIKNVFFDRIASRGNSYYGCDETICINNNGTLTTYMVNDAKMENVYYKVEKALQGSYQSLLYHDADSSSSISNMVIEITDSAIGAYPGGLFYSSSATMQDVIYIGNPSIRNQTRTGAAAFVQNISTGEKTTGRIQLVAMDAEYLNGVKNTTNTANFVYPDGNTATVYSFDEYAYGTSATATPSSTPYEITVIPGIRRYTLDFVWTDEKLDLTSWDTKIWNTNTGSFPKFN